MEGKEWVPTPTFTSFMFVYVYTAMTSQSIVV